MKPSKSLKTHENSLGPALPAISAAGRRKGRLMTTYDDFFGAALGKFLTKSICWDNLGAGNDDFRTTR